MKFKLNICMKATIFSLFLLAISISCTAQLSGTYTIPGSYASIASAVTTLNAVGVSGNVIFDIAAGHTENAPVGGIVLQYAVSVFVANQSNAGQTVIFQKSGAGANPIINAFTGTQPSNDITSLDGIFKIVGVDYVTINGVDLSEIAGNASEPNYMEMGYGLLRVSNTDGAQNCSIRNCVVTLNKNHNGAWPASLLIITPIIGSVGIFSGPITNASTTSLTAIGATTLGANSNNSFYGNTIQNVSTGIVIIGITDPTSPNTYYDQSNIMGSTGIAGNTVNNFIYMGCYTINQNSLAVSNNNINNITGGGVPPTLRIYGIFNDNTLNSTSTINNNTIDLTVGVMTSGVCTAIEEQATGTGTSNVDFNTITLAGGGGVATFYGILRQSGLALLANFNVGNNNFRNINIITGASSGLILNNNNPITNQTYHDNYTSGSATPYVLVNGPLGQAFFGMNTTCVALLNSTVTINNNSFTEMTINNGNGFCGGILESVGTNSPGNNMIVTVSNNIIRNIICDTSIAGGLAAGGINGIQVGKATGLATINNNLVENITGAFNVTGINANSGSNINIHHNLVRLLTGVNLFQGIYTSTSSFGTIESNEVYTCRVLASPSGGPCMGIRCENASSTASLTIKLNSIYDLYVAGTGIMNLTGISLSSSTAGSPFIFNVYNNLVAELSLTSSAAGNNLIGIQCQRGFMNVYFNTIALGYGSSLTSTAVDFGVAGLQYAANTSSLDLRNNLIYVNATTNGTGIVSAVRRGGGTASTAPANFAATSNYNIYYAPNTTNSYLYSEGTTTTTVVNAYNLTNDPSFNFNCSAYKTFMSTANEDSTATEIPPFIGAGIIPSVKYSLTAASLSYAESGGEILAMVPTDFNAVSRPNNVVTNRPDIGFTEFVGSKNSFSICIVLPIELIEFNGISQDDHSKLYWQTATEINNDYFILEKSADALAWRDIAKIDGAGNSTQINNYSFNDYELLPEMMYYRLKQVDFDGKKTYSQIVTLHYTNNTGGFAIFPNPSKGIYTIKTNATILSYDITDNLGQLVHTGTSSLFDISMLANGVYFIKIKLNNEIVIKKIIKNQ